MKHSKLFHRLRYLLISVCAALVIAGIIVAIPSATETPTVANALTATNVVLPESVKGIFEDYTMTSLKAEYDTLEKLNEYKERLGSSANTYITYLDRAEDIIRGKVSFNGMREFSTEKDALNPIDQYGDLYNFEKNVLKWNFVGNVTQVTGIYGISNETFTVYVDADAGAKLPSLVVAHDKGHSSDVWRDEVTLRRGINTFTFPFANYSRGTQSGVVYILNPYTEADQGGDVSLYIEGGGFYPVYKMGDDEDAFVEQVKEFDRQRKQNPKIPDIAELLPDYALLTITASSVYEAYVTKEVSPKENLELWSDYFTQTFAFNGMTASPKDSKEQKVLPYVRINIRHMAALSGGGAYTYYYHVGVYNGEDKWLANYKDTTLDDYNRFACIGHEIGHMLDTTGRTLNETTNNMNAAYAYYRILGKPASKSSSWLPFTRSHSHIMSDYTLDYKAYDDGYILYNNASNYDHNYMMWYQLESVFPGYWGKLDNCYRYDTTASALNVNVNEKMVYYSSIVTGVDLSEYFERWGMYLNYLSNRFRFDTASSTFKTAMNQAKSEGKIKEDAFTHFWYADAKEMDFMLAHPNASEEERAYTGENPTILSVKVNGNKRELEIGGKADKNLLCYEIYSKDGNGDFKLAGFTYSSKFTDSYDKYSAEPTYVVRGVNRFFRESEFSDEVKGTTVETKENYACKIGGTYYTDLNSAFDAAAKNNGTVSLLADCKASSLRMNSANTTVTIEVDGSVQGDVKITYTEGMSLFYLGSPTAKLVLKGNEKSKIIIGGEYSSSTAFSIYKGNVDAEHVVVENYSAVYGIIEAGGTADVAKINFTNCRFENCTSINTAYGVVSVGKNAKISLMNCAFVNCSGYSQAAIGFTKPDSSSITLDGCEFEGNGVADIYVNGDYTFENGIPKAVVDFAKNSTIKLDKCDGTELNNITLKNKGYRVELNGNRNQINFVELEYQLTFQSGNNSFEYKLTGTNEFVLGKEGFTLGDNQYIDKYVDQNQKEYRFGEKITVDSNMTFTIELKHYILLTLKYQDSNGVTERTEKLKEEGGFYLPRFDDSNKEIIQWTSGKKTYWAGSAYSARENDTLYAVYAGQFCYAFMDGEELLSFDYAVYGKSVALPKPEGVVNWLAGEELYSCDDQCQITAHTLFYAIHEGEKVYNLSEGVVELEADAEFVYDGQAKVPQITVKLNGETVPLQNYTVSYTNNVNAGTATVNITGKGNYFGKLTETFEIKKAAQPQNKPSSDDISVPKGATTLEDIELPDGWEWLKPQTKLVNGTMKVTAQYVGEDRANYETTQVTLELTVEASGEGEDPDNGDDGDEPPAPPVDPDEGNNGGDEPTTDPDEGKKPDEGNNGGDEPTTDPNGGKKPEGGNDSDKTDSSGEETPKKDGNTAAVVIGVCLGVVGVGAIGGVTLWFIRRRRRR